VGSSRLNRPRRWHALHVLWLPVLLALIPLAEGIQVSDPLQTAVVGFSLIIGAFMGEVLFRGIALCALLPTGTMRAVFLSSVLFGLVYTAGGFLGKPPLFVLAQIMISASFGLCVAAVRLRTGTIWTAVFLHALTNVLRCSSGPDGIDGASQDAVLIAAGLVSLIYVGYGLFLLRHEWFSGPRSKGEMEGSVAA
jgi:uncharacterized protein